MEPLNTSRNSGTMPGVLEDAGVLEASGVLESAGVLEASGALETAGVLEASGALETPVPAQPVLKRSTKTKLMIKPFFILFI